MPLLEVNDLRVVYGAARRRASGARAVDGVSFSIERGESVGLVGESGCGKSSLAMAVAGCVPAAGGTIRLDARAPAGQPARGRHRAVQMVFQDPHGSLNPRMMVGDALREVLAVHRMAPRAARRARVAGLLASVGLPPAFAARYPHELSGGQRQRVGLARALAVQPLLLIADEPVSALDVSVQAQILGLIRDLRARHRLALLFIAHDLAVVHAMCERVMVMYHGRIVESGPAADVLSRPAHPYTEALLSAVPDVDRGLAARGGASRRIVLRGEAPSPAERVAGCAFHTRCHRATDACARTDPPAVDCAPGHVSRCLLARPGGQEAKRDANRAAR